MEADVEMNDAGNLSEADSLASTAPSEQGSEYEVEEILAERVSKRTGKKKFLLKWANYPIYRATWEPAEMFLEMEDAMLKWNEKTRKVRAGTDQPFDVDAWKKSLKDRERETQRRKEARRQKRAERAARKNDSNAQPLSRESSPDVPLARVSANRGASLASDLFVSTDDPVPKIPLSNGNLLPPSPITQSLQVPSFSGPAQAGSKPLDSSQSNVSENPEKLLPQPSPAATVITSEKSQRALNPRFSESAKSSQPSAPTLETSKTASSKQDEVHQGTDQTSVTRTEPLQKTRSLPSSQARPALGPLYTAFANKSKDRQPDISQLDLRRPSEFPARTAAGVPVPFAKMTASDKFRRSSQSVTKTTPTLSVSQVASPGSSRRGSPETMGPSSRPRVSSPRGFSLLKGGDCYRPGDSHDSSPPRRPDRGRSLGSRWRSPGARSRSPNPRSRSPDRRRRSPVSRRGSPRRVADPYRQSNASPFVTVTRPKSQTRTPVTTVTTRPSPPDTVTHTGNNTGSADGTVSANDIVSTNNTVSVNADALALAARPPSPPKAPMSAKEQIERMPIGEPGPSSMRFKGTPYFVNKVEVLAHIYFGAEKQLIGAVRLCGLSPEVKQDLLAAKGGRSGKFEMWFRHACTPDQYATLCREEEDFGGSNRVIRTCWMEGFADTNPYVFHMSEGLYWENKIGIYYPPENKGFVWLAYSPKSPDFTHLTQPYPEIDPWVPIRLAVRTPLAPIDALHKQQTGPHHQQLQSPAMAMVPYDPLNPSIIGASSSLDDVVRRLAHTPGLGISHTTGPINSNASIQAQGSYGSPMQSRMERSPVQHPHPSQAAHSIADPRLKRLSSLATSSQQPNNHLVSVEGLPGSMDTRPDITVPTLIPTTQNTSIQQPSDHQQPPDRNSILGEYFERNLKMPFKDLACVNGKPGGPQADVFYLHTPESVEDQNDCMLLKAWLEMNGAMVWSDWGKFVKNSKCGVILVSFLYAVQNWLVLIFDYLTRPKLHESFGKYQALRPKIRDVLGNASMGFWTFRVSRPLDYPDERYCQKGVYFQRIFAKGGAYLLTEDILHSLKETVAIVYWFYCIQRKNMGQWKLVCWPNLMERLEEKHDANLPREEQKLYGSICLLISHLNTNFI